MRTLVVGAGAIGGYFGGRLLEAGRDVTFLVRPRRAAELARTGLAIRSRLGDADLPEPPLVFADKLAEPFDLVLLACKAYDLDGATASFTPAVGSDTAILPLLNGIRHLDLLQARFGAAHVLGGQCVISTTLDPDGRILHLGDAHTLTFGELDGSASARIETIGSEFSGARFEARPSNAILQEMWEKWVFIAASAGITCLMRATIGDIVAAGAADLAAMLFAECAAIAAKDGFAPRPAFVERTRTMLTAPNSPLTASLDYLFAHQLQPQFRYTNVWAENDLVIWDHLGTLHRAIADYGPDEIQLIRRCQVMATKVFDPEFVRPARELAAAGVA